MSNLKVVEKNGKFIVTNNGQPIVTNKDSYVVTQFDNKCDAERYVTILKSLKKHNV